MDFFGKKTISLDELIYENAVPKIYYKELAMQTGISLIANAVAKCEMKVYNSGEEVQNQIYYELNIQPNPNENSSQMWHKAIEKMIYDGEALIVNVANQLHVADSYSVDEYPIRGNIY